VIRSGVVDDEVVGRRTMMRYGTPPVIGCEGGKVRWVCDKIELLRVETSRPMAHRQRQINGVSPWRLCSWAEGKSWSTTGSLGRQQ
jgi:hypothetical protein